MKIIQTLLALIILAFVVLFVVENIQLVDLGIQGFKITLPVSLIAIGFYVLGAVSGTLIFKIVRNGLKQRTDSSQK